MGIIVGAAWTTDCSRRCKVANHFFRLSIIFRKQYAFWTEQLPITFSRGIPSPTGMQATKLEHGFTDRYILLEFIFHISVKLRLCISVIIKNELTTSVTYFYSREKITPSVNFNSASVNYSHIPKFQMNRSENFITFTLVKSKWNIGCELL